MNRDYWDRQAAHWDDEIFDSLREDVGGAIRRAIRAAAREHDAILDFGCGVGGYLPFLATQFARVHAVDWSVPCVDLARRRTARLANVTVERAAPRVLARLSRGFPCVIAANVVIHPDRRVQNRLWRTIRSVVSRGATGIFVVPSLEAAAYVEFVRRHVAPRQASPYDFQPRIPRADSGTIAIDGVPTKHYGAEELAAVLRAAGFRPTRIERASYRWSTETFTPPRALRSPLPWDWLAVANAI